MKAYTDLEQAKKLAKILPFESADMCYIKHSSSDNPNWEFNEDFPPMILGNVHINEITAETLPCWSLAVLLSFIPCSYEVYRHPYDDRLSLSLKISNCIEVIADNEIDACYEMIMRLKELKIL